MKKTHGPIGRAILATNCGQFPLSYHFTDDEIRGRKCRGGNQATTRVCLQCAVTEHIYQPGDRLVHQRKVHRVCRDCGLLCSIYEYPHTRDPVPINVPQHRLQAQQRALEYNVWVRRRTTRTGVFLNLSCTPSSYVIFFFLGKTKLISDSGLQTNNRSPQNLKYIYASQTDSPSITIHMQTIRVIFEGTQDLPRYDEARYQNSDWAPPLKYVKVCSSFRQTTETPVQNGIPHDECDGCEILPL